MEVPPSAGQTPDEGAAHDRDRTAEDAAAPRPLFVPRGLVMLAALWVFTSWILLFGFRPPVQPQTASYGPTLEILFASVGVGIAIGWPLLRLSARPSAAPLLQSALDAVALAILLQVVVWPLRLVSSWTLPRTWMIVGALGVSIALSGAVLALTAGSPSRRTRTRAMAARVALAALPLAVGIVGEFIAPTSSPDFGASGQAAASSWRAALEYIVPVSAPALLARCAEAVPLDPTASEWRLLRIGGGVGAALWLSALLLRGFARKNPRRPMGADPLS